MIRESIFISHAQPEDNDFTRWLGSKLELAGYRVWHDLDRLKGGDLFWDKIEAAIRDDSFRVVAVVSKVSIHKQGVKNEWALAGNLERKIPGFIIPVCIDADFDFSLLPIEIIRKNTLGFGGGWHKGLSSLLDTLADAQAPRVAEPDPLSVRHWLPEMKEGAILQTDRMEMLDSNWLSILELPPSLENARIPGTARKIKVTEENKLIPWFEHEDRIVGFSKSTDLVSLMSKSVMLKAAGGVDTATFLAEGSPLGDKPVRVGEARKRVGHLVRQAWDLAMEAKGLRSYELSGGKRVFYVPVELTKGEFTSFVDFDGKTRKKKLNGRSEKRKANWSYGVGIVPSFDGPWRVELRSTIVFTGDDGKPLESTARAHSLRRSFCRSWWNDRWRGFLRAFLALVADGQSEIRLPVGSGRDVVLGALPMAFRAPCGLSDIAAPMDVDPVDDIEDEDVLLDDIDENEAPL